LTNPEKEWKDFLLLNLIKSNIFLLKGDKGDVIFLALKLFKN